MTAAQNHAEPIATAKTATAENDLAPRSFSLFSLSILPHAAYACLLRALHAAAYTPPFAGIFHDRLCSAASRSSPDFTL